MCQQHVTPFSFFFKYIKIGENDKKDYKTKLAASVLWLNQNKRAKSDTLYKKARRELAVNQNNRGEKRNKLNSLFLMHMLCRSHKHTQHVWRFDEEKLSAYWQKKNLLVLVFALISSSSSSCSNFFFMCMLFCSAPWKIVYSFFL